MTVDTGSRSRTAVVVGAVLVILAAGLGLTFCGGDGGSSSSGTTTSTGPGPTGSSPSTTEGARTPLAKDGRAVTAALFAPVGGPKPVASVEGTVDTYLADGRQQPAVADIVAVEIGPADILLRWRIRSTGPALRLQLTTFSSESRPQLTASEVTLMSPAADEEAGPFRFSAGQFGRACVCSITPIEIDATGQEMTGLYPLFSSVPTEVEVRIPGFPPITAPVTVRS